MVFFQAVLEAVLPITYGTADPDRVVCVDNCLARRMRALRWRCCGQQSPTTIPDRRIARGCLARSFLSPRPLASVHAFVRALGAVLEAVGPAAGLAAEGEEVELVAVAVLAVCADGFEVVVHGGEGLGFWRRGRWCRHLDGGEVLCTEVRSSVTAARQAA